MAQGRVPEASSSAGERVDLQDRAVPVPEAAATAYGGIGAGGLVLLAKPLPSRAGYYAPFAVVRLQDLPGRRRGRPEGLGAQAAAPLGGEGTARHLQLLHATHYVVVPEDLSRQLAGVVSPPGTDPAVKFAGAFESDKWFLSAWMEQLGGKTWIGDPMYKVANENSESTNMAARRAADAEMGASYDGGLPAPENAARIVGLLLHNNNAADAEKALYNDTGLPAPENAARMVALPLRKNNAADAEMAASYDGGLPARENAKPIVALLIDNGHSAEPGALDYCNGLVFPREDAVPMLLGSNRAAEDGAHHHYSNVFMPSPENLMAAGEAPLLALRFSTYAVQVSVDAAAGAKAGDPIAVDVKAAAGEEGAGPEHDSLSAVVGIVVASSAATALAAGAVGPVTAFGLFAVLVGGLSLAMASVRAP